MTVEAVLNIASDALWTIIITAAPLLLLSMVVGLIISIFQTVTSIQEQTLTFVPKIVTIFIGLLIFGSYILNNIVNFMERLWSSFGEYI
ncbi:MAG: flagellar biosynthesis protein FliQ [Lachnospiraceae bacterium]|nr:flagellar biosynthesis protein FliQ [Lachnospiraceae bacterium]